MLSSAESPVLFSPDGKMNTTQYLSSCSRDALDYFFLNVNTLIFRTYEHEHPVGIPSNSKHKIFFPLSSNSTEDRLLAAP